MQTGGTQQSWELNSNQCESEWTEPHRKLKSMTERWKDAGRIGKQVTPTTPTNGANVDGNDASDCLDVSISKCGREAD